jgi:hypothetical protein
MQRASASVSSWRSAKRLRPSAFRAKVFAVSNIPIRVPEHFMGRDDALAAIATALNRELPSENVSRCLSTSQHR